MPLGDSLGARMGADLAAALQLWGETITIIRSAGNAAATAYIDRPLPTQELAPPAHEYDLVMPAGAPTGAPLSAGELLQDSAGQFYLVRVLRPTGPLAVGTLWRCNAIASIWRVTASTHPVSGITDYAPAQAVTAVHCRITLHPTTSATQSEGQPRQVEGRWITDESYTIAAPAGVLLAGDEVEAPGFPRLKVGRPAAGDPDDPSWEVPATPVLPRGVPGREV